MGRSSAAMTLAMVNVLPEPVTPSSVECFSPAAQPLQQLLDRLRLIAQRRIGADELEGHPLNLIANWRMERGGYGATPQRARKEIRHPEELVEG